MTKRIPESVRLSVLKQPPEQTVRVYTIQHQLALDRGRERGYMTGEPEYIDGDDWVEWKRAYDWMRARMAERIAGYSGEYPMWAWLKRPNMRQWTRLAPGHALVVADVPRGRMVLSCYDSWHHPLNGWLLYPSEAAFDADDRREPPRDEVEASWQRVFEMRTPSAPGARRWLGEPDRVQLCIDRIRMDEIVRITPVTGRRTR